MAKTDPTDTLEATARARWGGLMLAAGALLAIVALALQASLPALASADAAARAAQISANAGTVRMAGYTGMVGFSLLALGGMFLSTRAQANRAGLPAASWLVVAFAGVVGAAVYGIFGTGYVALAEAFATQGPVFNATLMTILAFAGLANLALGLGAAMALVGEATSETRAIPAPVAYAGVLGAAGIFLVGVGYLTGILALLPLSLAGFLLHAVLIAVGARAAWPGAARTSSPAPRGAKA